MKEYLHNHAPMKKILLFLSIFWFNQEGFAQQVPLFTNYIVNEYGFNPALAGSNPYLDARLTYRTQWVGIDDAPRTQILTAHGPLKDSPLGVGGTVYNDIAGRLKRTGFAIGGSIGFKLGSPQTIESKKSKKETEGRDSTAVKKVPKQKTSMLRVGVTGGAYGFQIREGALIKDQDDETVLMGMNRQWHPDLNIGVHLDLVNGVFAGVSAPQLLRRDINLGNDTNDGTTDLVPHFYGVLGYNFRLNDKIVLQPSALLKYVNSAPLQIDFSAKAQFQERYWIGASYRSGDAVSAIVGIDLSRNLFAAYAYDYTLSGLKAQSQGSHEITIGIRIGSKKDRDKDGVIDEEDPCPDTPGPVENQGCPEEDEEEEDKELDPEEDEDDDGVKNKDDKCPEDAGLKTNAGCPLGDRDEDGLRDDLDLCPDEAGLVAQNGCPLKDRDKDGIIDDKDVCPDDPGPLRLEGCPEAKADADGDGIPDHLDECPNSQGKNGEGCPVRTYRFSWFG